MRIGKVAGWFLESFMRMFPHPTPPGLRRSGNPGPDSPVFLTCNFTLTVRRLLRALAGRDAWVLVANSHGINVWCAAGGGYLTHHDVIAVLRFTEISGVVNHRRLILPQLAATGVEPRKIREATGWEAAWGPARLEDLPLWFDQGGHVKQDQRVMRFPLWERLEMALMWAWALALVALLIIGFGWSWRLGLIAALDTVLMVFGVFAALPQRPATSRPSMFLYTAFALLGTAAGAGLLAVTGSSTGGGILILAVEAVLTMLLLSVDLAGTTPLYASSINTYRNRFALELLEERCTGAADCIQVCPRDVLRMNGPPPRVEIVRPVSCILCGACIVQCPEDALRFRYPDGRIIEPATIRRTRMNMAGRRTVEVEEVEAG